MTDQDLKSVYRECVLKHSREPLNFGRPEHVNREAIGFNPLCGDKLTVFMTLEDDKLDDVAFEGTGCAISLASASMMTEILKGTTAATADQLINAAQQMFASDAAPELTELQEFRALEGVRAYPSRIKCATLAWTAAKAALQSINNHQEQVTTE